MIKISLKTTSIFLIAILIYTATHIEKFLPDHPLFRYFPILSLAFLTLYLLFFTYERYLWNKKLIKIVFVFFGFREYPDIEGEWEMEYFSSYKYDWNKDRYKKKDVGKISIKKIGDGFSYSGNFNESSFKSSSNFIERAKNNKTDWLIGYKYNNDPNETQISGGAFVGHSGFVILNFDATKPDEMTGFYGNDENRKTRGKIILKRIE